MAEIRYENNTLAKITMEGRIVDSETGAWVTIDLPAQDPIKVYLGEGVTVEVVAPPEWPPIADDVWVVAVATLTGCHQADQTAAVGTCCGPWGEREYATKKGVVPAWHLTFAGVRRLPRPVPCPGQVFVPWALPADVADQVQAQVDARAALAASLGGDR